MTTFQQELQKQLLKLGATLQDDALYAYKLTTYLGILEIHVNEDWVACRFADAQRAARDLADPRLNRHSGKWNHHYTIRTREDAKEAVDLFMDDLTLLLQ